MDPFVSSLRSLAKYEREDKGDDASADVIEAAADEMAKLSDEVDRLTFALQTIHDTFAKDIARGYKTRDKTYAIEIARAALRLNAGDRTTSSE